MTIKTWHLKYHEKIHSCLFYWNSTFFICLLAATPLAFRWSLFEGAKRGLKNSLKLFEVKNLKIKWWQDPRSFPKIDNLIAKHLWLSFAVSYSSREGILVAKLLYSSRCLSVRQSFRNAMGETWFSRFIDFSVFVIFSILFQDWRLKLSGIELAYILHFSIKFH